MPTFQKCDSEVCKMAAQLLKEFESHQPLLDAKVTIDLVFAYGDRDEEGNLTNDALKKNGVRALGLARKIALKDRVLGRGDAEICLDGDWWTETATEEQQRALLDHELHHIALKLKDQQFCFDSIGRPLLRLRKHDVEVGWFGLIAQRHGVHSMEQIQAKFILDAYGQYLFPQLVSDGAMAKIKKAA